MTNTTEEKELSTTGLHMVTPVDKPIENPKTFQDRLWNLGYKFTHEKFTLGDLNRFAKNERKIADSEIEAAEKAKVEEVIAYVENAPHRVKGYEYGEKLCKDTRNRFLTKHDDEN